MIAWNSLIEISYTTVPADLSGQAVAIDDGIGRYLAGAEPEEPGNDQVMSLGKADMLIVNRSTKSDNLGRAVPEYDQLGSASDILDGGAHPIRFE